MSLNKTTEFLKNISIDAGKILMKKFRKKIAIMDKEGKELVSSADHESESYIVDSINKAYPDAKIIAEERESSKTDSDTTFIIDPLDGTHNFLYGIPVFCVSIAFKEDAELRTAVIYDPVHNELFSAIKGSGAYLNNKKIKVSATSNLSKSILATGFPYARTKKRNSNLPEFSSFLFKVRGIRRLGSAALDLCYVACGRLDGFWEKGLKAWDISAGGLIVKEAGGKVSNFYSNNWDNTRGDIVASNGLIHEQMLDIIKDTR